MVCRSCGADVGDSDRFCNACGARLTPQAAAAGSTTDTDETAETAGIDEPAGAAPGSRTVLPPPAADDAELASPDDPTGPTAIPDVPKPDDQLPDGQLPDDQLPDVAATTVQANVPPPPTTRMPTVDAAQHGGDDRDRTDEMPTPSLYDLADEADPDVTSQLAAMAGGAATTPAAPAEASDATARTAVTPAASAPAPEVTTTMTVAGPSSTGEVPSSYTPYRAADERLERFERERYDPHPHRFRFRVMLVAAILAAGAAACAAVTNVIEITAENSDLPTELVGTWMVNDFGTNSTVAMAIAGGAMVIGALLGCFGFRWGGGLAGGAGLAVVGWSGVMIALAEEQIARSDLALDSVTFTRATFTRDLGYWLVAGAGALGVLVFLVSLTSVRRDRATNLNPWVAALGAAACLVAAAGPLLPVNEASIESNWTSTTWLVDEPIVFFIGRLVQPGLLAFTGLVGFLLVRRYGLGLAAGGLTVYSWLALTALLEQTDQPIGPAIRNPGAEAGDTIPHAVTIGGLAVAVFCLLVAAFEVVLSRQPDE